MGPLLPSPGARGPEWEPGTPAIPRVGEPEAGGTSGEGARRARHSAYRLVGAGRGLGEEGGHLELGLVERTSPGARTPISAPAPPRPGLVLWADGHHSDSPAGSQGNKRKLCVKFGAAAAGQPGVGAARWFRPRTAAGPNLRCPAATQAIAAPGSSSSGGEDRPAPCPSCRRPRPVAAVNPGSSRQLRKAKAGVPHRSQREDPAAPEQVAGNPGLAAAALRRPGSTSPPSTPSGAPLAPATC